MIYKIYKKVADYTSNYLFDDYLIYLIFILIVLFCSLRADVYGQGAYKLNANELDYTVTADPYAEDIVLPAMEINCPDNNNVMLAMNITVSNFIPDKNNVLNVSLLDNSGNQLTNNFTLTGTQPIVINYAQNLGPLDQRSSFEDFLLPEYPYNTNRGMRLGGELNKGMQLSFSNVHAYSQSTTNNKCIIVWEDAVNK